MARQTSVPAHHQSYADLYQEEVSESPGSLTHLPLLQQFRFYRYLLSTLSASIANNALVYTMLIVVIQETGSGVYASLFVLCSLLPSILLGLVAGIVVDYLPNKAVLVAANLGRAAALLLLLNEPTSVAAIYVMVLLLFSVQQFSSPAASSALPTLLPRERYSSGQAHINVVQLLAQLIGMVILAPIILKVAGPEPIYAIAALLYALAAYFVLTIPRLTDQVAKREDLVEERSRMGLLRALSMGWRTLRSDPAAFQAMVQYTLLEMSIAILVVLMPDYAEEVIHTSAENLVFVFSPAALGLLLGMWLAPIGGRAIGNAMTATIGWIIFVASIAGFAFSGLIGEAIERNGFVPIEEVADFFNISIAVVVSMLLAVPAGMGAGIVGIAAKAVLLERAPAEARGRIFSTQSWASGVLSIIPIFIAGLVASTVDVRIAIFLLAFALASAALYARYGMRPEEAPAPA